MMRQAAMSGRFHESADLAALRSNEWTILDWVQGTYDFENFFHPLIGRLIRQLNAATGDPVAALLDPAFLDGLTTDFFASEYQVTNNSLVDVRYHPKSIDLDHPQPYANYNWELLYHIPIAVAVHLSRNQRFAEAQKWFHYVFDPTSKDVPPGPPESFWKFLYFRKNPATLDLADLITLLSTPENLPGATETDEKREIVASYHASVTTPFMPFAVARPRPVSFQYYVVMAYLDNLIAWGDNLFSQMTIETVNEATLCYVLAANLLGPRPQPVPQIGSTGAKCFNDLKAGLDPLSDALVALEAEFPFNITVPLAPSAGSAETGALFGMGQSLYFCVPPNAKLLGYWDTVDDRLSKVRNCENVHGQVQLMPLFDPPIDPGMLVAATAAGLDVGSVVSGLNQPVSPVRSPLLIQKALELSAEVKALGTELLSAIEKGDAEHLATLRQTHEIALQRMMQDVRYLQWQQSQASTEALLRSRATTLERYTYYLRLLGQQPDESAVPTTVEIDHGAALTVDTFDSVYQDLVGKYDKPIAALPYPRLRLADGSSPAAQSGASGSGQLYLNANEDAELNNHMPTATDLRGKASYAEALAAVVEMIPGLNVDLHFWGLGLSSDVFSGVKLSAIARIGAEVLRTMAGVEQDQGAMAARTAGYQRRADDWLLQANLAARELNQLGRQTIASLITEQAACQEYQSAKAQVGQSQNVLAFLQTKFSNEELYGWMQGHLSNLYYQYYRFALDTARKAEATMKWELMRPELDATTYIAPDYWDGGRQGLLTGEALYLDVKRMELDYHTYNLRELELTRHVSLRQLDPVALLALKATGACTVSIPEWLFDRDCPGHYMRRIKTVAMSIPSVVGPYATVNCTLSLQHSSVRLSPSAALSYSRDPNNDDTRFVDYYGTLQSIVTSGAVSDSGMFETNLRDERFLPFEGAGVVSTWTLSLPPMASFDYGTITDIIMHVRYTARDGGQSLAAAATSKQLPPSDGSTPVPQLPLLLNLRHDFPSDWYAFTTGNGDFTAQLTKDYFPYLVQGATLTFADSMTVYRIDSGKLEQSSLPTPTTLAHDLSSTGRAGVTVGAASLTRDPTTDYYLVLTYTAKPA
jgi:hypothetical protein